MRDQTRPCELLLVARNSRQLWWLALTLLLGAVQPLHAMATEGCDATSVSCDAWATLGNHDHAAPALSFTERLAESGINVSGNLTQFYFGTVGGGLAQSDRYSGHGDYVANMDLGKLGIQEGLFVKIRAEHRFGQSIGRQAGVLLPPTLASELPVADSENVYLTNFLVTQFLSERFGVYAGKLDTLDGDANAYASGRGITQFSNTAFIANPIALRTIPYSSLGFGFVILDGMEPLFNFLVINPTDTSDSDGFNELFAEGVAISAELRLATNLLQQPGHQLFGATWSNREYVSLGQDPRIILPNIPIARTDGSWSLYWNTDQAIWVDPSDPSRHWGYFARAGVADDSANPINYLLSAGLGGASPLKPRDSFGVGYFYSGTSGEVGPILQAAVGPIGDSQGVECFYRMHVSNCFSITPDFQWIQQARENVSDAYILGLRANLQF